MRKKALTTSLRAAQSAAKLTKLSATTTEEITSILKDPLRLEGVFPYYKDYHAEAALAKPLISCLL